MSLVIALLGALRASLRTRTDLALENLALRQQLVLLRRRSKRPQFGRLDRLFWLWLSHQWGGWRGALHVVRPQTVIRWHRQGFRAFWTWKSRRGLVGRPPVSPELAELVRTLALANPLWCSPPIHGEWLKLGLEVSQRTVARLIPRRPKPPSQSWRTFLHNHLADLVSVDFFVVPTATFRVLYVFGVLLHHRRRVVHFNVTDSPTAACTAQQIVEAFPDDSEEIGAGSRDDLAAGRAVDVRPYPTRWPAPHKGLSDLSHDRHHRSAFMGSAARIEFWPTIAHQPSSKLSNNYTASRLRAWRSTFSLT